ncbi:prophenin and tritrpticin precursor-like [Hibiscus syriacus]|uniref:prophenin and tritrpticin precursor-like n=1 Tax=Hibiscus syriacus TaxID=106335 RepID=UPI0019205DD3|nr:prophenin and tritrpticin precursor-like [Hibiscus syriacus]
MANSHRLLILAIFIALSMSFSAMDVAQARRLLQAVTTTAPPVFPNVPPGPFRGFPFPPFNGPYPEYRLPPFPGISNVPPSAPGFPGSFPIFPAPPTFPNPSP